MDRIAVERAVREVIARMEAEACVPMIAAGCGAQGGAASGVLSGEAGISPATPAERTISVEVSARHVHLSREDLRVLFGTDDLTVKLDISQPGQFLSDLRVRLIGPKGVLDGVAVLGPVRSVTQAEISITDARKLGVCAPVNRSGDLSGAATVFLQAGEKLLPRACAIVARRHIHMTPEQARTFGVVHGDEISLAVMGSRPVLLTGVVARVSPQSALALHIDTDEANAAGASESTVCRMVRVPLDAFARGASAATGGDTARSTPAGFVPIGHTLSGSTVSESISIGNPPLGSARGETDAAPFGGAPAGPGIPAQSDVLPSEHATASRGEISLEGHLISERDVLALPRGGVPALRLNRGQLITPLAADALRARGITLLMGERA